MQLSTNVATVLALELDSISIMAKIAWENAEDRQFWTAKITAMAWHTEMNVLKSV